MNSGVKKLSVYQIITMVLIVIIAVVVFLFPLYWIITGAFKTPSSVNNPSPDWWPKEWVMRNFDTLFDKRSAPLWELHVPLSEWFTQDHSQIVFPPAPLCPPPSVGSSTRCLCR